MKEEMLNKISELSSQISRLEQELKGYIHDEEASEPIKYNIDKRKWEIEELLMPVKEELNEKEEQKNIEIEKITKEANDRIERLEKELKGYIRDEEASEPIQYNIDKIKWELEEKVKNINQQYEIEKDNILKEIEKTGIDLEQYGLKEKEEIEESKETKKIEEKSNDKEDYITGETKQSPKDTKVEGSVVSKLQKTEIINPILIGKNADKSEEDKIFKKISSESIRIIYDAKTDKYFVRNINIGKGAIVERKKLQKMDKNELAEKLGKEVEELNNIDTNVLQILQEYDQKYNTSKVDEYINVATQIGKSKKDRQQEMEKSQIDIKYNLKGLYDNELSKEEREELLSVVNNASKNGIATVKKGPKVFMNELMGRILNKVKSIKVLNENKILSLPQTKKQKEYEKIKQEEYDKLTNKEYMQSLDKDFRKAVRQEKTHQFIEKINIKNIVQKHVDLGNIKDDSKGDNER